MFSRSTQSLQEKKKKGEGRIDRIVSPFMLPALMLMPESGGGRKRRGDRNKKKKEGVGKREIARDSSKEEKRSKQHQLRPQFNRAYDGPHPPGEGEGEGEGGRRERGRC